MTIETLEHRPHLDLICKQISCLDENIDLVAILNERGRVEDMISREDGINRSLSPHKREMLFMECVLQASMYKDYDDEFGKVRASIIQREKIFAFSFQMANYLVLVITKPVLNSSALQQKIATVIFSHDVIAN